MQGNLLDILSVGKENAITGKEIMQLMNYDNVRGVTKEISRLRKAGAVVCSTTGTGKAGYYLPSELDEAINFRHQILSRIREMQQALVSTEEYIQSFEKGGGN